MKVLSPRGKSMYRELFRTDIICFAEQLFHIALPAALRRLKIKVQFF